MKKTLMILGVVLLIAAALSFGVSLFYHWSAHSVLDGSASLYARLFRSRQIFFWIGIGLLVCGVLMFIIRFISKTR